MNVKIRHEKTYSLANNITQENKAGFDLRLQAGKRRYLEPRNGGHLLVPFQC